MWESITTTDWFRREKRCNEASENVAKLWCDDQINVLKDVDKDVAVV